MAATTTVPETPPVVERPYRGGRLARILSPFRQAKGVQRFMLLTGTALSFVFVFCAIFAPLIAPFEFDQYQDAAGRFPQQAAPSAAHHWGTTVNSFDVLSRTIWGARTPLGLISGYVGGWLDRILVLVMDALFAFPYLLLAIVASFLLKETIGNGIIVAAIAITVVYVPQYFRVVRASTLSARESTYIEAARAMGAKPRTIIHKYLFANVVQSVPVIGTLNAADAILTLAGLGFLGLGIQPTEAAEWGYDLQRAIAAAGAGIWWTALYPGLAIVLAVTSLTLVGEGLNDILNPTLRRRRNRAPDIMSGSSAVGPASAGTVEEDAGE